MKAIVAMTADRVIGREGKMPWHLPEDFRWFRKATLSHAVLMGRKTLEAIGKPLPGRLNLVATRGPAIQEPGVVTITDLSVFSEADFAPQEVWVIGGAEIYAQMLPRCEELFVSLVAERFEGDTFFPPFEGDYDLAETILQRPEFEVRKYLRKGQER
jgi:dihydrofolate reductase